MTEWTHEMAGVIFDGAAGQAHNDESVVSLAQSEGFELCENSGRAMTCYIMGDPDGSFLDCAGTRFDYGTACDWAHDIVGEAIDWLNDNVAPPRCYFEWHEGDFRFTYDEVTHEEYDEFLDECHKEIAIGELRYSPSAVLKAVDPIAYRCGFDDYERHGPV